MLFLDSLRHTPVLGDGRKGKPVKQEGKATDSASAASHGIFGAPVTQWFYKLDLLQEKDFPIGFSSPFPLDYQEAGLVTKFLSFFHNREKIPLPSEGDCGLRC